MRTLPIELPLEDIRAFCRRHHILKLGLFGSVLRPDFRPDSDVDVLVEFDPAYIPGLSFFTMQEQLGDILGRRVDLNTSRDISPQFREDVVLGTEVIYGDA